MKKFLAAALVLMLLCTPLALADNMMVHITAICDDPNHVGTYWQGLYAIGDLEIHDGDVIDLDVAKYEFYTEIGEYDSSPDIGSADTLYNVTENRLLKGFTVEQYVTVTENKGVYKGYWTEWYVRYDFIPVGYGVTLH